MLADAVIQVEFAWRHDGLLRVLGPDGMNLAHLPVNVLGYVAFVPLYWLTPRRWRGAFLWVSSLAWTLVVLGAPVTAGLAAAAGVGWAAMRVGQRRGSAAVAAMILGVPFATILAGSLALPRDERLGLYFLLHMFGGAYLLLRVYQVAREVTGGRLARPRPGDYLAYALFGPTLRLGPLYRAEDFLAQLRGRPPRFEMAWLRPAAGRLLTGAVRFGGCLLLLERFPPHEVFMAPGRLGTWTLLAGVYAQPAMLYLVFSGYTDWAVGLGRLMGFRVPENFRRPWLAASVRDFWRRWHITLGGWLREQVYIPLGGNRRHVDLNYLVTFGFCAVWHGLCVSYMIWAAAQAAALSIERWWRRRRPHDPAQDRRSSARRVTVRTAGWLVTVNFEVWSIAVFMDTAHAGRRFLTALLASS